MNKSILIFLGIGLIQSAIFALLTVQKKNKSLSDWILILWFISCCVHFGCIAMVELNNSFFYSSLAKNFILLYGPFLWLYIYSHYYKTNLKFKYQYLHFLPFVVLASCSLLMSGIVNNTFEVVLVSLKLMSLIAYPLFVLHWIHKKNKLLKTVSAHDITVHSNWLKTLALLVLFSGVIGLLHVFGDITLIITFSEVLDIVVYVLMITTMGYLGLRFGILIDPLVASDLHLKPSYVSSPLKDTVKQGMVEQITQYFDTTDDYLDHQFSLGVLSNKLGIPKHHLSEVINAEMNSTFYDIVNSKRVQYALQKLKDPKALKLTLEGIGYEAGFNTKSAFYHHMKEQTGKTPGQIRKEIRPD